MDAETSHPTDGSAFVNKGGKIIPLTEKELKAAADARSNMTPEDMRRLRDHHDAKVAAASKPATSRRGGEE